LRDRNLTSLFWVQSSPLVALRLVAKTPLPLSRLLYSSPIRRSLKFPPCEVHFIEHTNFSHLSLQIRSENSLEMYLSSFSKDRLCILDLLRGLVFKLALSTFAASNSFQNPFTFFSSS